MIILGIETSCDDTCISVIKARDVNFEILSNVISSQVKIHAKYGGVYPFLAKREHQRNLPIVLGKALKEAGFEISNFQFLISKSTRIPSGSYGIPEGQIPKTKLKIPNIDAIAVTVGPGLEPCLWTGINFGFELAKKLELPIIPVNHLEAHILANFIGFNFQKLFPAICLVVSGGNTQLLLMKGIGKYKLIGETRDDAAGECLDKVARILDLGYPGGPAIAAEAAKFKAQSSKFKLRLPRPMIYQKNYDFSFSGLKTAVLYDFQSRSEKERKSKKYLQAMAYESQQAVIDVLIHKTIKAAKEFGAKSIILGGGVAANDELRKQFKVVCLKFHFKHLVPPKKFCTDNAAMIALAAFFHRKKGTEDWKKIKANANLKT